jgi:O-antigen ligase
MVKNKMIIEKKFKYLDILNVASLMLIAFLLPINQNFISPIIGIWIISSLIKIINKPKLNFNPSLALLILFYVLLIIGLLWTDNLKAGGFDLEVKMSMLIFPLLFTFLTYSKRYIKYILYSFLLGIFISALFLIFKATQNYIITESIDSFFYINLSPQLHPSYFSFYVLTALILILLDLKYKILNLFFNDIIYILFIIFLSIFNLLLLSKIGVVCSLILLFIFLIEWMISKKKYILSILILSIVTSSLYFTYQNSSYVKSRTNDLVNSLSQNKKNNPNSSTGIRLKVWKEGIKLIKEKPFFGYGTGDVKDELMARYKLNNIERAYQLNLNAHNQFIQITIALGLLGLLLFLSVFWYGIKQSLIQKNYYLLGYLILSIIFMLPESMLENQAGTIAFSFFFSLFNQNIFKSNE